MTSLGLDEAAVRFLEIHETRAHLAGDRELRELGDCVLIHSPSDREPFVNRVGAVRLPEERDAFDRRVGELISLFGVLDRRPHFWTPAAFRRPLDIDERLVDLGFQPLTASWVMLVTREVPPVARAAGVTVERWQGGPSGGRSVGDAAIREVSRVLTRAFGLDDADLPTIEAETRRSLAVPTCTLVVVRDEGAIVAAGKGHTFDGATYLSSIGTDPRAAGRGHGTLLVGELVADARAAGSRYIHLAVRVTNDRAIELYRRCGFEPLDLPAGELLLA